MSIKKIIKRIIYKEKADAKTYIKYLRNKGMKIGKNLFIPDLNSVIIDETRPWLINIGYNVQITDGVNILTHGYDWSVLKGKYGEIYNRRKGVAMESQYFPNAINIPGFDQPVIDERKTYRHRTVYEIGEK